MEDVHKLKTQDDLEKNKMNNSTTMNDQPEDRAQNDSKKRQPKDRAQNDSKKRQPKDGAQNDGKQNKCASEQDKLHPYSMYPGIP